MCEKVRNSSKSVKKCEKVLKSSIEHIKVQKCEKVKKVKKSEKVLKSVISSQKCKKEARSAKKGFQYLRLFGF